MYIGRGGGGGSDGRTDTKKNLNSQCFDTIF